MSQSHVFEVNLEENTYPLLDIEPDGNRAFLVALPAGVEIVSTKTFGDAAITDPATNTVDHRGVVLRVVVQQKTAEASALAVQDNAIVNTRLVGDN